MHCHICDAKLSDNEIKYEKNFKAYAPCTRCIDASGVGVSDSELTELDELEALVSTVLEQGDVNEETTEG